MVTKHKGDSIYSNNDSKTWIRGVNVGGWLLAERFITPYLFAVNTCHLKGDLCWYHQQMGAPSDVFDALPPAATTSTHTMLNTTDSNASSNVTCDPTVCEPVLSVLVTDGNSDFHPRHDKQYMTYPIDEYTLGQAFQKYCDVSGTVSKQDSKDCKSIAQRYMERHWDTFVTYQDLVRLKEAGVTHLRVPMGYWIRGDVTSEEPWISGGWPYFVRLCQWCREIELEVWADLHGAPGSENGFDNSGRYHLFRDEKGRLMSSSTCVGWSQNSTNVARTLRIIQDISNGIVEDSIADVVTGFGLLNEPFLDCDETVLRNYYNAAFAVVRTTVGYNTSIFVGDTFRAWKFNNGWWGDSETHYKTYLDSHPYHVFFEKGRALSPKQHIAYTCRYNSREVESCCYEDFEGGKNTVPSKGISRIMGEWSGAYDVLPTAMAPHIMKTIARTGKAPLLNRTLSKERKTFLENFVKAQMVTYESQQSGVSSGWLFWNFKMEGGAFAEWDFLRGIDEGWIPRIPDPSIASEDIYGSCYDILNRTTDDYTLVVQEYPDPRTLDWRQWQGWDVNDDFVVSDSFRPFDQHQYRYRHGRHRNLVATVSIAGMAILIALVKRSNWWKRTILEGYRELK